MPAHQEEMRGQRFSPNTTNATQMILEKKTSKHSEYDYAEKCQTSRWKPQRTSEDCTWQHQKYKVERWPHTPLSVGSILAAETVLFYLLTTN